MIDLYRAPQHPKNTECLSLLGDVPPDASGSCDMGQRGGWPRAMLGSSFISLTLLISCWDFVSRLGGSLLCPYL